MTTDAHNDQKRKSEKASALLSLAAERGKVRGQCPSDEEMAALVEGRSGEVTLSQFLDHLSRCDRCYEEWIFLKKSMKQHAPRVLLHVLGTLTKLRYIGTALAAAASIAVYLNVVRMEEKVVEQAMVPQAIQDNNLTAPPAKPSAIKEEKGDSAQMAKPTQITLPAVPPAAPAARGSDTVKERLEMESEPQPRQSLKKSSQEQQKLAASAPVQVERPRVAKDAGMPAAEGMAESTSAPVAAPPLEEIGGWLAELRTACLSNRQDVFFWKDMAARGLQFLSLQASPKTGLPEEKVVTILALVQGISGPDVLPQQCRLILAELAKEDGSR